MEWTRFCGCVRNRCLKGCHFEEVRFVFLWLERMDGWEFKVRKGFPVIKGMHQNPAAADW